MELNQQIRYANYLGNSLLMLGLVLIGIGVGYFLSIQSLVNAGCPTNVIAGRTMCQQAIFNMNNNLLLSIGSGIFSMVSGGGILYYIRRVVP